MSWYRAIAIAAVLSFAGCTVTPLEGTGNVSASGGSLAGVDFAATESRLDQKLRNALLELAGREATDTSANIRFDATVTKTLTGTAIRRGTGRSSVGKVRLTAVWSISDIATGNQLDRGQLSATSSFDRFNQEFANQEAERDAETRAAQELAQRLRPFIVRAKAKPAVATAKN
ncbi:MAG: LPS assembly lipoprotein LptE [Pseudomonadota bacterium]